ncbi:MAG: AAA family ATPase [bacterium]|nr:AAA family ATPase [bacterium]
MDFIGQHRIVDFFDNAIKNGRLAHAYCLVGLDGVGKRTLAELVAGQLLNVPTDKLGTQPDYFLLKRESDAKTGKLKKEISIAQTRDLVARLQNKAWLGGYRVVVIDEAETMNEESGNALLKLLEEPGGQTVFFLLVTDEEKILLTVRSRCQLIQMSPVPEKEMHQALVSAGYNADEVQATVSMSWGRPGRALNYLRDETIRQNYIEESQRWKNLQGQPFYQKIKISDDLFGDKTDHIRTRDNLASILDLWIMQWRAELREGRDNGPAVCDIIETLAEAKNYLTQNIHPRLLVERAFLKF